MRRWCAMLLAVVFFASLPVGKAEETPAPDRTLHVEVIRETAPSDGDGPRVLIYHTHTWEAYTQVDGARYEETEKWRTADNNANVVAVGAALASSLRALGCTVVQDDTAFEPPNLDSAYQRSLTMLERRTEAGESYDLYIDLHRDAISSQSTIKRTVDIGGVNVARFMVLVGKGTGSGFDVKPDWEANYAIAELITESLNGQCDSLARDIKVKTGRFNQHIAPQCVLIECGNNENTLQEVLDGVPYLAQAVMDALRVLSGAEERLYN
ncbi:MAG: stage II sporulation protein P [Christensenellaceae bacterium]|nr:stage II sporulation protein P [Christensenellaceae bacterium]